MNDEKREMRQSSWWCAVYSRRRHRDYRTPFLYEYQKGFHLFFSHLIYAVDIYTSMYFVPISLRNKWRKAKIQLTWWCLARRSDGRLRMVTQKTNDILAAFWHTIWLLQARGGQKLSSDNLVTSVPTLRRIIRRETKENRVKLSYCRLIKQSKDQLGVTM